MDDLLVMAFGPGLWEFLHSIRTCFTRLNRAAIERSLGWSGWDSCGDDGKENGSYYSIIGYV